MRTDPEKSADFYLSQQWNDADLRLDVFRDVNEEDPSQGSVARSFSGFERNRMFLQTEDNFDDITLVSGADSRNDSRGFVLFDFDRDGWLDMGITSPLSPRFRILRNQMGKGEQRKNNSVFVSVRGGNEEAKRNFEWSARDAIGANLLVTIGDRQKMYQVSCGEGLAAQNSRWIHIGMGSAKSIDRIDIDWPSGKKTTYDSIDAGSRLVLWEDGNQTESTK